VGHADRRLRELELEQTLPPQDGAPRRGGFTIAAALRLAGALRPVSHDQILRHLDAKPVHHPRRVLADEPQALWSPLDDLDARDHVRTRVRAYCRYVRCLITADSVAAAAGISKKSAYNALLLLRQEGKIVPVHRIPNERGTARRIVWEWADDAL
jgi:hypothetical protein